MPKGPKMIFFEFHKKMDECSFFDLRVNEWASEFSLCCKKRFEFLDERLNLAFYVKNDLSYNFLSVSPCKIKKIFFEILLINLKPVTIGTIYVPQSQSNFLELLNDNMNKIDSVNNEIFILGDFNIILHFGQKNVLNNKSIPSDVKGFVCYIFASLFFNFKREHL